jgi:DNA (cytosine-5)-methyltransferase 1
LLTSDLASGSNEYTSIEAIKKLYKLRTGKESSVHKYHVIRPNEPSNTIPAHLYKDGLRHIHWDLEQCRTLTVREAARLQTFDDDFEFLGSMGDQYKMIGNAVPPLFAKKIALSLKNLLSKRD